MYKYNLEQEQLLTISNYLGTYNDYVWSSINNSYLTYQGTATDTTFGKWLQSWEWIHYAIGRLCEHKYVTYSYHSENNKIVFTDMGKIICEITHKYSKNSYFLAIYAVIKYLTNKT